MNFSKRVLAGTGTITLAGVFSRMLSMLSIPILSSKLGAEPYGTSALVSNASALGTMLALTGIDQAYARLYLHGEGEDLERIERYCWRHSMVTAAMVAVVFGVIWLMIGRSIVTTRHQWLTVYIVSNIPLSVLTTMAIARARITGQYSLIAKTQISAAVVSLAVSLLLVQFGVINTWTLLLGMLAGALVSIVSIRPPSSKLLLQRSALSVKNKKSVILMGVSSSITAPMYWVISSSDRWVLARDTDTATVGIYSLVSSLVSVALILNNSITLTWFPEASRLYAQSSEEALSEMGSLWGKLVLLLALVWLGICATGGGAIRLLTPTSFHSGAKLVAWLAGGVFFYGVAALANTAFFLRNRMQTVAITWVLGAALSLIANFALIPRFGALGAAISQCLSFAVVAVCLMVLGNRLMPLPIQVAKLMPALVVAAVAGWALHQPLATSPLLDIVIKLPLVAGLAAIMIAPIAPEWLRWVIGLAPVARGMRK
jgi:O-antigen/teichoic acid export membrane protein